MHPPPAPTGAEEARVPRHRGPLRPTAAIATDVVLPDDPALALALAQELLLRPRMANHSFGLWGYSGKAKLGGELTVQAGGLGAPCLAAVLGDLAAHGASRVVRVGRCVELAQGPTIGEALIVEEALAGDGVSRALGSGRIAEPDPALTAALAEAAPRASSGRIASVDALFAAGAGDATRETPGGVAALDLETAALLALAKRLGVAAAALLVVAGPVAGEPLPDEEVKRRVLTHGLPAAMALARGPVEPAPPEAARLL